MEKIRENKTFPNQTTVGYWMTHPIKIFGARKGFFYLAVPSFGRRSQRPTAKAVGLFAFWAGAKKIYTVRTSSG
jgi:hypothetical protein